MTTVLQPPLPTPEEILALEGRRRCELVDDVIVEKPPMGRLSGKVTGIVFKRIAAHVDTGQLGELLIEVLFQCFPNKATQARRPDIAFIKADRLAAVPDEGIVHLRPDLAIEVVSPTDEVYSLDEKLFDYRAAGIPLVWIINPAIQLVKVYRPGKPVDELFAADTVDGGNVLPGFSMTVADLLGRR